MRQKGDWMQTKWRPAMGWMYMVVCIFDFIIFPIAWNIAQIYTMQELIPWQPITIAGAGLFHMAMGAVLGVAAWGRTKEKLLGVDEEDPRKRSYSYDNSNYDRDFSGNKNEN